MTKAVKDSVKEALEKLIAEKIPITQIAVGPNFYHRFIVKAPISNDGKRELAFLFYGLNNVEEFPLPYTEFIARYKTAQKYFDGKWLHQDRLQYAPIMRDRFEIATYQDDKTIARSLVVINGFTGNCGARTWTGIPLGLNVDEWKFVNEFLRLTYPRIGLFLASHNTRTINNYLQPMLESGWKQTEPVYNPNSTNNIAVLMLAINQPKTIK